MSSGPYTYIWEFEVRAEAVADFERSYGPDGPWIALFRRAQGYIGSHLLKDRRKPGRYVTIDRWQSERSYRSFRSTFAREYEAIDAQCEGMTVREEFLGEFSEER